MQINSSKRILAANKKSERALDILISKLMPAGFVLASKSTAPGNIDIAGAILTTKVTAYDLTLNRPTGSATTSAETVITIVRSKIQAVLTKYALFEYNPTLEHNINIRSYKDGYVLDVAFNDVDHIEITVQNMRSFGVCVTIEVGFP